MHPPIYSAVGGAVEQTQRSSSFQRGHAQYVLTAPLHLPHMLRPRWVKRPGDLLMLKVVSESRVTWATSVPILVFQGLSVLELRPKYATDRRQTKASLNAPAY